MKVHVELDMTPEEARRLMGDAVTRLSPVPLPRRLVYGRGRR